LAAHADDYRRWPSSAAVYLPGGSVPEVGSVFRQPDLAGTLQYMADQASAAGKRGREAGLQAAHDAFYRGDIARAIVAFHRQEGGWMAAEDLAEFEPEIAPPVSARYGDRTVLA